VKDFSVNTANCSHKELVAIAKQCGFEVFEGKKHESLNKHTAKGIVQDMSDHGAKITIV